ncbi:MAG: acetyltransferase [Bacteroidales bacterium]|nr:acetyltransferase [Bacteroidales bacterium]
MILYGASGHAKVLIDTLKNMDINISCLFDDDSSIKILLDNDVVTGYCSDLFSDEEIIISVGDNKVRKVLVSKVKHNFGKAVSNKAVVSKYSKIGIGSVIFSGVIVQADTKIGEHCIINTRASVDHDCLISDFVHIAPGSTICGGVKIGEGAFIGAGAIILPNLTVGNWVTVGAGAVVTKNIPANEKWVGNPAKSFRKNKIEKNT